MIDQSTETLYATTYSHSRQPGGGSSQCPQHGNDACYTLISE
ncbi:hypothetical protein [Parachitinimonas caeni]|uniref:Uncharacterized protein n=1 Tax=Parachitinimonas caeni TaxID=3031301 RepID=A0ABT7DSP0_9NEIS|nr:hypothetical protein [Parachitinimonas caeni]MDK2123071.1 hypothetical protein [Parachitinimonas caeni]